MVMMAYRDFETECASRGLNFAPFKGYCARF